MSHPKNYKAEEETDLARQWQEKRSHGNIYVSKDSTLQLGHTYQTIYDSTLSREQQCHQVFKTSSYEAYKDQNPARLEGTCGWVLEHRQYQYWRTGNQYCLLWISADPGCGKSVLSKSLADRDLRAGGQETICYFFFKDNNEQDSLAVAICALLHQLFAQQPLLTSHAIRAWEKNGVKLQNECRELWRILLSAAADRSAQPIICILDALDECRDDDQRQLIRLLCELQLHAPRVDDRPHLKFVVTSRPYDNVQRWFHDTTRLWPKIRLRGEDENEAIHDEINLVIQKRVEELGNEFMLSNKSQLELHEQLLQMQHRTYLWLHLAIEEVRQMYADSLYPDEVTIPSIPSSVEDAYERLLQKITAAQRTAAYQVLLILVGARRPLTIAEMASALGAARARREGNYIIRPPDEQHLQSQIRQWCGLFVFIQHSKLFLIHQTAKEFLIATSASTVTTTAWRSSFLSTVVEKEMADLCTIYLLNTPQATEYGHAGSERDGFWQYCAEFWVLHAQCEDAFADSELLARALALSDVGGKAFSWFTVMWKALQPNVDVPVVLDQHVIAMNGHTEVFRELCKQRQIDISAPDSTGKSVLLYAAEAGHLAMIRMVLEAGADVNVERDDFGDALGRASLEGHKQIVKTLLEAGANVNAQGGVFGSALHLASLGGHEQIVQTLLWAGADVNADGDYVGNALQAASICGDEQTVQTLLNAGVDVNARSGLYGSALQAAAATGHEQVVRRLLNAGADVNAQGGQCGNALQAALDGGHEQVIQTLLREGADVNAR